MTALDFPQWSLVSDADHLAAFTKLPAAEQAAHLTGRHQLPTDQTDGQHLVDIHGRDHEGRS